MRKVELQVVPDLATSLWTAMKGLRIENLTPSHSFT